MKARINEKTYTVAKVTKTYSKAEGAYKVELVFENTDAAIEELTQAFVDNGNVNVSVEREGLDDIVFEGLTLDYIAEDIYEDAIKVTLITKVEGEKEETEEAVQE